MSPSTASSRSLCLGLALAAALAAPSAMAAPSIECADERSSSSSSAFESATLLHRVPIHLSPLPAADSDEDLAQRTNASAYNEYAVAEEEYELPSELAAMISAAKSRHDPSPAAAPTLNGVGYYASYAENACGSKSTAEFESWEEGYGSREECCEVNFGWDYDACVASV